MASLAISVKYFGEPGPTPTTNNLFDIFSLNIRTATIKR
jgi:hypothetical protein